MLKMPAFFFPTTVLILDDDKHFSHLLKNSLGDRFNIQTYSCPSDIAHYLEQETAFLGEISSKFFPLSNANKVKSLMESGLSHKLISVIVTDYQLENASGLEVLTKCSSPSIQKILMSNFLDLDLINNAYKKRSIDMYIHKLNNNFIKTIGCAIHDSQRQFFINYCRHQYDINLRYTKLYDQTFTNVVNKIIQKLNITHMIANDRINIFEMESELTKEKIFLHVVEDQDIEDLVNSIQAERAPSMILDRIRKKLAIPCFNNGRIPDGSLWAEYMKPINQVHGIKSYYISCYNKNEGISLDAN